MEHASLDGAMVGEGASARPEVGIDLAPPTPQGTSHRSNSYGAALLALGVVYGDIGTSPLYAMRESLRGHGHAISVTESNVLGLLSLIFWSLMLVITIKYLLLVMRADNHGEGGILALVAQISGDAALSGRLRWVMIGLGIFGTALLYGDGMITPAISVLSAVEGTSVATSALDGWAVPLSCAVLIALFALQRRGTAAIGTLFGPLMLLWFAVLAGLGIAQLVQEPSVLRALNPMYAVGFFSANGFEGFLALGGVFLVVTGGEALYADMGHFGRGPIQRGWIWVVLPALVLNYFGQGALLLRDPEVIANPFFSLVPQAAVLPLVVLATMATVVASQALISGAFSLTVQAVQLGYVPRLKIVHTSDRAIGQVYVPAVNWALLAACVALVVGFGSSAGLASAYGVAVTATMVITTVLFAVVAHRRFHWPLGWVLLITGGLFIIDLGFLGANLFKIPAGGWFALTVGVVIMTLMTTWGTGRSVLHDRISQTQFPLSEFRDGLDIAPLRVPGTAVYLFSIPQMTPPALIANLRHNRVLHERVLVVAVSTEPAPRVDASERSEVQEYGDGLTGVVLRYGFMEEPDVAQGLTQGAAARLRVDPNDIDYFLGSEQFIITRRPGMARWREHLFDVMSRNATPAANYFRLPPDRTTIIGMKVEL